MVRKKLQEKIKINTTDLMKWFAGTINPPVCFSKCVRGRARLVEELKGAPEAEYIHLHTYCRVVRETNPGSIIELECNGNVFVRIFFAFVASVNGFAHCRPLLVLDGAHIRGKYKCCLLRATARDANDQCFPVTYAVVDAENEKNWKRFLVLLKRVCDAAHVPHNMITIMSDRDKGLIPAVSEEFGDDRHAYCVRHVSDNLLKSLRVNKEQAKMLLEAARSTSKIVFDYYMQRVEDFSKDKNIAEKIFEKAGKRHWGGPHFLSPRYGKVTSQVSESTNNRFLKARGMPPIPLIEETPGPAGGVRPCDVPIACDVTRERVGPTRPQRHEQFGDEHDNLGVFGATISDFKGLQHAAHEHEGFLEDEGVAGNDGGDSEDDDDEEDSGREDDERDGEGNKDDEGENAAEKGMSGGRMMRARIRERKKRERKRMRSEIRRMWTSSGKGTWRSNNGAARRMTTTKGRRRSVR
ncbi:hypothetical protein CBR_g78858 [Chara braunii]|uniref:MULE transposase domain-containing protein n=1 Tax=Chara braunii TaxID=69332 RepID=A0A388KAM3_CHABU|nr:hypothetical protein CBR_g78858 [Chara braunii]|eukprot:GBG67077.1 hypothetical protein CBR_g78858 [Chara braunii]